MKEKLSILVVDNDKELADKVCCYLNTEDVFNAVCVYDGESAYNAILDNSPDIVLSEIVMPKMDGICLARRISKLHKNIKLLGWSYSDSPKVIQETMKNGFDYYMIKPQPLDYIKERIYISAFQSANISHEETLEQSVTKFLHKIGMPAHIKGYTYIRTAIIMTCKDTNAITHITKHIYPEIAKQYSTDSPKVERCIRHAILALWNRGNKNMLSEIFYINKDKQPSNSEFIALVADHINMKKASNL